VFPVGDFEDVVGGQMALIGFLRSVRKQLIVQPRRTTIGVMVSARVETSERMPSSVETALRRVVGGILADRNKRLTTLLTSNGDGFMADTSGGAGNDAAFFKATAKYIPRTARSFINAATGDATSSAAVFRAAVLRIIGEMSAFPNSFNGFVHMPPENGAAYVVMVPPILWSVAQDAFLTAPGSTTVGLGQIAPGMSLELRVNPDLATESAAVAGAKFYVFMRDQSYKPLVAAVRGMEEIRSTIGDPSDVHRILFDQELFQPYYAEQYGYGSDFLAYQQTDS
jgi:hypothetical protein